MTQVTINQFAEDVGLPLDTLRSQLAEAGIRIESDQHLISDKEKARFLRFLKKYKDQDNVEPDKVVLRRKINSELKVPVSNLSSGGRSKARSRTINVETRKRRIYAKRGAVLHETQKKKPEEAEQKQPEAQSDTQQPQETLTPQQTAQTPAKETQTPPAVAEAKPEAVDVDDRTEKAPPETTKPPAERRTKRSAAQRTELHVATNKSGRRRKNRRIRTVATKVVRQHVFEKPSAPIVREVEIPASITVADLAQRMSVKASELIKMLIELGNMATINEIIDQGTAEILVHEMGHKVKLVNENALEEELAQSSNHQQGKQVPRPPVVTVMGHVDHGKTTLLDHIRKASVAANEVGGITQHIGAYRVTTPRGKLCFLDTPGHEAFSAMRARGTRITDIVVIVVAADDGVKPQTEEAIKLSRAANVPFLIALNKIDREDIDPDRVKQELGKLEVVPEEWGGDVQFLPISAKTGQGVDELLEGILLQAEILELQAADSGPASGTVLESRLDRGKGAVASVLVQSGELKQGDTVLVGHHFGRIRSMVDDHGNNVELAKPSCPVEIQGLSGTPAAGSELLTVSSEKKARELAALREQKSRENRIASRQTISRQEALSQMTGDESASLNLLIKADVQGSVEAMLTSLQGLGNDDVKINIVSSGIGGITESDTNLAITTKAIIIGFNVRMDTVARKHADAVGLDVRYFSIIYDVIDDVNRLISGMRAPEVHERITGLAEVQQVFNSPTIGNIAGCLVISGTVKHNYPIRVLRENVVIYEGELESLRRFRDDVKEVKSGTECGIGVKNYNDVRAGDQIEVFERVSVDPVNAVV